jgi:hypothetical protein
MRRLLPAFDGVDAAFVSVAPEYAADVPDRRFYTVPDAHRMAKMSFFALGARLTWVLARERPRIVITTGAAPGYIALVLAKSLLRSRTVWIDSIANCECMSTSGLLARRFADVWLTQWPHLAKERGPQYWGAVL